MRMSWNEIRARAARFADEWAGYGYERGQTQLFYKDFFDVFGLPVRRVAAFEDPVRRLGDRRGYIDLFWKGILLVEQKSQGNNLGRAKEQALDYFPGLKDHELPRYLLLSDFQTFELYDLETGDEVAFRLEDLPDYVEWFSFILGVEKRPFRDQDPVNIEASELVADLHEKLEANGYKGHDLERFLVRIVFCMFADHTGIFDPRNLFLDFLEDRTREDGSDLGGWLTQLFQVLDTPHEHRARNLDEDLARFPHVNGDLFAERLEIPSFDSAMRRCLLDACAFNWAGISPAIFGSLFQSVMDPEERRNLGAHYTTEKNILKVIQPLFLDDLWAEFERIRGSRGSRRKANLQRFHDKLAGLRFFDPACGCGNFLIIAYREVRQLELEVIKEIREYDRDPHTGTFTGQLDAATLSRVNVDQFYGIELEEFPARIAETALWMMDHIMNNRLSLAFGKTYARIPLRKSPHIRVRNALEMDWNDVVAAADVDYVFGNPPFVGHQYRSPSQQQDMHRIWGRNGQVNRLDYVTCWFRKAAEYAGQARDVDVAFVATNSITQGEQAGILWPELFRLRPSIFFAHRTFQWNSEARRAAAVHCVIVGLTFAEGRRCHIFEYDDIRGEPHVAEVPRINGYLIAGPQYAIPARTQPPADMPRIYKGSQPTDGARQRRPGGGYITYSNLILDADDRAELLAADPNAEKWLRPYVGGDELISGRWRWCLWLKDADPGELRASAPVMERLERVRRGREQSPTPSVQAYARYPTLFTQDRQPDTE